MRHFVSFYCAGWLIVQTGAVLAAPVLVKDALGRTVRLENIPQRIVPIFSSNTELVAALGLVDRIVGIEAFTRFPPEVLGKPLIGGRLGFSVDTIVKQSPDLVVVTPARQAMHQVLEPMSRLNIPVIVLQSRSVHEVIENLRLLGRATGTEARAEPLARLYEARLQHVQARHNRRARPRAILITGRLGNGMVLIARSDTYTGDALRLAGADHALEQTVVPQISPEALIATDPDVLLYAGPAKHFEELLASPGWSLLRAVRDRRTYLVDRSEFLIPGDRKSVV